MKQNYKDRAEALKLKKKGKLLTKQREKEKFQEKQLKKKTDAVNILVSIGVRAWLSEEDARTEILIVNEENRKVVFRHNLHFSETHLMLHVVLGYLTKPK